MTNDPLVTIIMATYHGEAFLEEQLDSIIAQDYKNIELLIADDDSCDKSCEILTRYSQEYKWIHLRQNRERIGLVKNFEKLLESAQGNYIAFCDQDDVWREDKIQIAVEALQREDNSRPLMFHSDLTVANEELKMIAPSYFSMRSYSFRNHKQVDVMLGRCGVMGNTMVINQELKSIVLPFPDDLKVHDYWIALINELYGKRLTSQDTLIRYRLHQTNSSNKLKNNKDQKDRISYLSRDKINLPFFGINREETLKVMLKQYQLEDKDRRIVLKFIEYLKFKKNRFYLISLIFRYNFLRDNLFYRLKIAWKMAWKRR